MGVGGWWLASLSGFQCGNIGFGMDTTQALKLRCIALFSAALQHADVRGEGTGP